MLLTIFTYIFRFFFWKHGWTVNKNLPDGVHKCVMIAAPHTSNWDFVYMAAAFHILGIKFRFTVKKELAKFPSKQILESFGAIWIDRSPKKPGDERISTTEAMAELFEGKERLITVVTPEGTRSLRTEWKSGFYHVAKIAGVPIGLGYLDYGKCEGGIDQMVYPSDDMEADMRKIARFYKDIPPKHPEKFSVDQRYV
ncbi:MAG: 1-acyl-sn-glycerol-3-phosphate acyltransferase [Chitinophagales bacterium]